MEFIQYVSFCVWLISFSTVSSEFLHVVTCVRISFLLRLNNVRHMYIPQFVYPFIRRWTLGLLLPFAVVNNAAVVMDVQIVAHGPAFIFWVYMQVELLSHMIILFFFFSKHN